MKTGEILKEKLGLSNLKEIKIARVLVSTFRVYVIFYDSLMKSRSITNAEIKRISYFLFAMKYPFKEKPMLLPLMDLIDFNGDIDNSMFFTYDLAGRFGNRKLLSKTFESKLSHVASGRINEFLSLADLKNPEAVSDFTKNTRKQRNRAVGTENRTAKLIDLTIDTVEDHVTFIFLTEVTEPIYKPGHEFGEVDPNSDFKIKRNPSKVYELHIRILDFFKWLNAQKIDDRTLKSKDIKEILDVSNVQVFSTSPSLHWQGMNFNLSQVDASIYPTDIPPRHWDSYHGENYFLDKHLAGLLNQISFFENQMASMLTNRLQNRGLL